MAAVTEDSVLVYDESVLRKRADDLRDSRRALVAVACAERLMPLYEWIASVDRTIVRSALDLAWDANPAADKVAQAQEAIERLVPDEDDGSMVDVALVQNAIAAVAYALRTTTSQDAQDVVWAARQLHEAADYMVQREAPNQTYIQPLVQEALVQLVLRGVHSAFDDAKAGLPRGALRTRAQADGAALLCLFKAE